MIRRSKLIAGAVMVSMALILLVAMVPGAGNVTTVGCAQPEMLVSSNGLGESSMDIGPDGSAHVVFIEQDMEEEEGDYLSSLYYCREVGGSWTPPVELVQLGGYYPKPEIQVDANGECHVVYCAKREDQKTYEKNNATFYLCTLEGVWQEPYNLTGWAECSGSMSEEVFLGLDKDGSCHVLAKFENRDTGFEGSRYFVGSGTEWNEKEFDINNSLGRNGWVDSFDVDGIGNAHVAFNMYKDHNTYNSLNLMYSNNVGGEWLEPELLAEGSGTSGSFQVVMKLDGNGKVHMAYGFCYYICEDIFYINNEPGTWSQPVNVSSDEDGNTLSMMVTDPSGNSKIIFSRLTGSYFAEVTGNFYATNEFGGWTKPAGVSLPETGTIDSFGIDGMGYPHFIYTTREGETGPRSLWYTFIDSELGLGAGFDEYLCLLNPNQEEAKVEVKYIEPNGREQTRSYKVKPLSRYTVDVNSDLGPGKSPSALIQSDKPIVAERPMYFFYRGETSGGSCQSGIPEESRSWYLAEGYTGEGYTTYLIINNPQEKQAEARIEFAGPEGIMLDKDIDVAPHSRTTLEVNGIEGMPQTDISISVDSSQPVVVERSLYFNTDQNDGGHGCAAMKEPSEQWYFAEGCTLPGYETYLMVWNAEDEQAELSISLLTDDEEAIVIPETVGPGARATFRLNNYPEAQDKQFSISICSSRDVVSERVQYFQTEERKGSHGTEGAPTKSPTWYFSEGYTAKGFDTYLLISNPNQEESRVRATFLKPEGETIEKDYTMDPGARKTIVVDEIEGLESTEVSMAVETLDGTAIVSERAMYFTYSGVCRGGHDTIGVTQPSKVWYFAEGYTGM